MHWGLLEVCAFLQVPALFLSPVQVLLSYRKQLESYWVGVDSGGRQWANSNQEKGQSRKWEMWGESEQTEEEREEREER